MKTGLKELIVGNKKVDDVAGMLFILLQRLDHWLAVRMMSKKTVKFLNVGSAWIEIN